MDVKKMIREIALFQDGDWVFSFETSRSNDEKRDQVFYLPIKNFFFHIEAAQITYKELEVKRKKMAGFYDT
jgi:hypothetical protein